MPNDDLVLGPGQPWVDEVQLQRRRILIIVIGIMVLAALIAFAIAGTMSSDYTDEPGVFGTPPGTGESLPSPQMKQPVKRRQ